MERSFKITDYTTELDFWILIGQKGVDQFANLLPFL